MGFKKYVVFSIILIIAVFGYVHSLELGNYNITILNSSLDLPVAAWVVLPVALLSLVTYLHLVFYGLFSYWKLRAIKIDHETMIELLKSNLLENSVKNKFKTKEFKNLSAILSQFKLNTQETKFTSKDEELNKIVTSIQDIKDGKYVNERTLKVNETTLLANLNMLNKVNEQIDFAVDVLKKPENFSSNVVRQSFENVLKDKTMTTIKKLYKNVKLDKDLARKLFEKDAANNEFGFTTDEIIKIVKDLDYNKDDFIELAKIYEAILKPDQIIAIFENLSSQFDDATAAYLHVLFEYEMIDKAREIVSGTADTEFTAFKALLDLKEAGKHYNLEAISYK